MLACVVFRTRIYGINSNRHAPFLLITNSFTIYYKELNNFSLDTSDSAEYEEWRSELLFSLFLNYPQEMVSFLSSVPFKLRNEIYYELHFPVNDGIPITELSEKIHSEVKGYDDIKEQLDIVFLYVKNCHEPRDFSFLQETN